MTTSKNPTPATPEAARSAGTVPAVVGVLGGGRMGAGIAHAFLISGSRVIVVERDPQAAQSAQERIERDLAKSLERGAIDGNLDVWAQNLTVSLQQSDFGQCDLVIEAVPEDFDLKVSSLTSVESHLREDAWLASNTSSLSIDRIAQKLSRPERFCGLHFFNPVPASKLVEIVNGEQTGQEMREQSVQWVAGILPGELVSIVDVTNGARLETYTIAGERGTGVLGINGAAARLIQPGDIVILIAYAQMDDAEARSFQPRVVHVDAQNRIVELGTDPAEGLLDGVARPPQSRRLDEAQADL